MFHALALVTPVGADFEYLDTLMFHAECEINLATKMRRRAATLNPLSNGFCTPLCFELTKRHDRRTPNVAPKVGSSTPKMDHIPNIQKRLNPFLSNCALEFRNLQLSQSRPQKICTG
jgi:hypothetical protein